MVEADAESAHSKQRPKTVVVLGAGFSHAVSALFPLTDALGEAVRARLPPADRDKLPKAGFSSGRFEEWLSYLCEPQPHFTPEKAADATALALRVTRLISEVLSEVQDSALKGSVDQWFWEFLSVLHVLRADVITLNYDNLVESGVHTLGFRSQQWVDARAICEDDILAGMPPCAVFVGHDEQSPIPNAWNRDPRARQAGTFKLLKLHGSLSWFWLPDASGGSTLRRWRLPGTFGQLWDRDEERRRQELPAHEVSIVPPAALKGQRLREPVTKELWRRAATALRGADRVVLIGYSVPPADHSVTGMVSEALQQSKVRVEVINLCPWVVQERLVRLGLVAETIHPVSGDDCIAEWTRTEVSRLAVEAVTALRTEPALDGEVLMFADGPRAERFRNFKAPEDPSEPLILYVNASEVQLTKPVMYRDLQPVLGTVRTMAIEVDGHELRVIDYWVQPAGSATMAQLHLVPSGR